MVATSVRESYTVKVLVFALNTVSDELNAAAYFGNKISVTVVNRVWILV